MTKQQIIQALNEIERCKKEGYFIEAIFKNYHLNISILRFMSHKFSPHKSVKNLKVKAVIKLLIEEIGSKPEAKLVINKKSLKNLKPWLERMDVYIKTLKQKVPTNNRSLLHEGEKIFALLNISLTKLHIGR